MLLSYYNKNFELYKDSEKARKALRKEVENCMLQNCDEQFVNPIERLITSFEESSYKYKIVRKQF